MDRLNDYLPAVLYIGALISLRTGGSVWLVATLLVVALLLSLYRHSKGRWQMLPLAAGSAISLVLLAISAPLVLHWGAVTAAILFIGINLALVSWFPVPHLPVPSGSQTVGLKICELPNSRIKDGQRPTGTAERLQAYIWYPANPGDANKLRPYHSKDEATAFGYGYKKTAGFGFLYSHFRLAKTHSHEDAAISDGKHPMLIFNHGGVMWPTQNFSLMEELASHGFVVISLCHPGETSGVVWKSGQIEPISDDTVARMKPSPDQLKAYSAYLLEQNITKKRAILPELTRLYGDGNCAISHDWSLDSSACLDWLQQDAPDWLRDKLDWGKVAIGGMSIGGSAAHHACHRDTRFKAGFNLDGANWSFELAGEDCPVPFLQCYSDLSLMQPGLEKASGVKSSEPLSFGPQLAMFNDLFYEKGAADGRADIFRLIWRGASHMSFTDCLLATTGFARQVADTGNVERARFSLGSNHLIRLFLDEALGVGEKFSRTGQVIEELADMVVRQGSETTE